MNNTQINELFLSNKRLNEIIFELNNKVDLQLNNLDNKVNLMNNNIEKLYNQNLELLNLFHMKNNDELFKKLKNVNDNMEKLKNLSTLVSKEFSEIQNKNIQDDYKENNQSYDQNTIKSPEALINLENPNNNVKEMTNDLLSSINLN